MSIKKLYFIIGILVGICILVYGTIFFSNVSSSNDDYSAICTHCRAKATCGDLVMVNAKPGTDGIIVADSLDYYVHKSTKQVLVECGGWTPPGATPPVCPPKEWTCSP